MGEKNQRFETFFQRDTPWKAEKIALRDVVLEFPLTEELKWRQPVYCLEGRNVCTIDGYGGRCVLSFFKGVLLTDPEGLLEPPGPNSRSARIVPLHSADEVAEKADVLRALLAEAVENERAGRTVELPQDDFELPGELSEALDADASFREAWDALTPGRRRGWVLQIGGAKQAKTRESRVEKAMPLIFEGKGIHDR